MAKKLKLDEDEIARLYLDKRMTGVEIAKELGIGATTVMRVLHRMDIDPQRDQRERQYGAKTVGREDEIISMYRTGMSMEAVGQRVGVNRITVRNVLLRRDEPIRKQGKPVQNLTSTDRARIVALRKQGWTNTSIAEDLGTSSGKVGKVLREEGVLELYKFRDHKDRVEAHGYILTWVAPDDPLSVMTHSNNYAMQHRIVMARALGRPLEAYESVHHVNGDRTDNRLENLQLRQGNHGKGVRMTCHDCGSHNVGPVELH